MLFFQIFRFNNQSIKGLDAAVPAVREGGTLLIAAELSEGVGSSDFAGLIRETDDLPAFLRLLRDPGYYRCDQWQLQKHALAAQRAAVMLFSDGLPRKQQAGLFVEPAASVEAGLNTALARHGPGARVLVMPHGPYVPAVGRV